MKKIFFLLFICFTLLQANQKHILVLHSYNESMTWEKGIEKAIDDILQPNKNDYILHTEYMDTKRINTQQYLDYLKKLYALKYKNIQFNLILVSDNNAFHFIVKNRDMLFGKVDTLFCGVNFFQDKELKGISNISGITENFSARSTVATALKLFPKTEEVFIINDYLTTGRAWVKEIKNQLSEFKNIHFVYNKNETMQTLKHTVATLPKNAIVLLGVYFKDKNNQYFTYEKTGKIISSSAKVPVFCLLRFNVLGNVIGGDVISGYYQGYYMAKMARKVLNGVDINTLKVLKEGATKNIYNYPILKKYNSNLNKLPKDSLVINKPITFYSYYKYFIYLSIFLLLLLITLTYLLVQRKKALNSLQEIKTNLEIKVEERTRDLNIEKEQFEYLFNNTMEGIVLFENLRCIDINEAGLGLLHVKNKSDVLGRGITDFIDTKSKKSIQEHVEQENNTTYEVTVLREDGTIFPALVRGENIIIGKRHLRLSTIFDITKLKEKEKKLEYISNHDYLTDLYNRKKFFELAPHMLQEQGLYVAMMDIDKFKNINDSYGHPFGDIVLKGLSKEVLSFVDNNSLFARMGGEEFAFLTLASSKEDAIELFENIKRHVHSLRFSYNDTTTIAISISIGVAVKSYETQNIDELLNEADKNLYEAKNRGRDRVVFRLG